MHNFFVFQFFKKKKSYSGLSEWFGVEGREREERGSFFSPCKQLKNNTLGGFDIPRGVGVCIPAFCTINFTFFFFFLMNFS